MTGEPLDQKAVACGDVEDRDLLAQYVAGQLAEDERDAVEAHVIDCARCADVLETWLAARQALLAGGDAPSSARAARRVFLAVFAAAAVLVAAVFVARDHSAPPPANTVAAAPTAASGTSNAAAAPSASPTDPALMQLARVEPPAYEPFTVRSGDEIVAAFDNAMTDYTRGDYSRAAAALQRVIASDSANTPARFYLGVSLMQTDQPAAAATQFRDVIAAGASPFRESGEVFLAKALIRSGDLDGAAAELDRARRGTGPRAHQASLLLQQLNDIRRRRHS